MTLCSTLANQNPQLCRAPIIFYIWSHIRNLQNTGFWFVKVSRSERFPTFFPVPRSHTLARAIGAPPWGKASRGCPEIPQSLRTRTAAVLKQGMLVDVIVVGDFFGRTSTARLGKDAGGQA